MTSTVPLEVGASRYGGPSIPVVAHTQDPWDTGQAVYQWTRGRSVIEALWIENTGRLAVTITGFDQHGPSDWSGIAGPEPFLYSGPNANGRRLAFHAVRIPAGGDVVIGLAFPSNPGMCRPPSGPGVATQSSVTARFTVLGVFHNSQAIALDPPVSMRTPTAAQCAAAR